MKNHTLILSTAKIVIPEGVTIDFITNLINRGLTAIDYFGVELDNDADYVEEDLKAVSETICYFEFFFDTDQEINYEALTEIEVNNLILETIKKSANIEMRADDKDIRIYL